MRTKIDSNKIIGRTLGTLVAVIICSSMVLAVDSPNMIENPLGPKTNSLSAFFDGVITVVIELGAIISVLGIMYGGFLYVGAQGNEEQLAKAYKTITWALVGTAVLLGARTIMAAVRGTVEDLSQGV